jgi:hypothetical protein
MQKYNNAVIFLDIDGVLNSKLWRESDKYKDLMKSGLNRDLCQFDPEAVSLLNDLIAKTNSSIVVSSSWRRGKTIEELQELFDKVKIKGKVIGKTPALYFISDIEDYKKSVPRGNEIKAWIELNHEMFNTKVSDLKYVILDDDSDMLYWQRNNFVKTNNDVGLTLVNVVDATFILQK